MDCFFFFSKLQDGPCGSEKEFCKKYSYYDYPIEGMFCLNKMFHLISKCPVSLEGGSVSWITASPALKF